MRRWSRSARRPAERRALPPQPQQALPQRAPGREGPRRQPARPLGGLPARVVVDLEPGHAGSGGPVHHPQRVAQL
ncbi:MAG: hypothetical protein ACK559_01745, partial [bacterium]